MRRSGWKIAGTLILGVIATCACGRSGDFTETVAPLPEVNSTSVTVTQEQFLHTWPFHDEQVTLECLPGNRLIVTEANNRDYALNGEAIASGIPAASAIEKSDVPNGAVVSFGMNTCAFLG